MKSLLAKFGLTTKEEKIYLTCLELGENPASVIATRAGYNRSTTYVNLENLVIKGFVERGSKYGMKTYWATDPDNLLTKFERESQQLNNKIDQFKEAIPELQAVQHQSFVKPRVKFFQGQDAVKHMYESLMKTPEWVSFVDSESMVDSEGRIEQLFWDLGYMKRDSKVPTRDILTDSPHARQLQKECQTEHYQIKLYPERTYADNVFFPDKFFLASYRQGMQLLEVENKEMAESHLVFFEGLWKSLPEA